MLKLDIRGVNAYPLEKEPITAGRIGLQILFTFSDDWKDLSKIAVFEGAEKVELLLANPRCVVPEECLKTAGPSLRVGVYGIDSLGTVATPTVWANFGQILSSAQVSLTYEPGVTPPMIAQILSAAQSAVNIAQSVRNDADAGKFNGKDGKSVELFTVTYGVTTKAEIDAALAAGLLPVLTMQNQRYMLTGVGLAYVFTTVARNGVLYWAQCSQPTVVFPTSWRSGSLDLYDGDTPIDPDPIEPVDPIEPSEPTI